MINIILKLINLIPAESKNLDRARGRYKYPETWSELKRYLKFKINQK